MKIEKHIKLDFAVKSAWKTIFAKQGDNSTRYVGIQPLMNGVSWEIPEGVSVLFCVDKPDGHSVMIDGSTSESGYPKVEDGEIVVELTAQTLAAHGMATASISLMKDGAVLSTQNFLIDIEEQPAQDNLESSNEYQAFAGALNKISQAKEDAENAVNNANDAYEAAVRMSFPNVTPLEYVLHREHTAISEDGKSLEVALEYNTYRVNLVVPNDVRGKMVFVNVAKTEEYARATFSSTSSVSDFISFAETFDLIPEESAYLFVTSKVPPENMVGVYRTFNQILHSNEIPNSVQEMEFNDDGSVRRVIYYDYFNTEKILREDTYEYTDELIVETRRAGEDVISISFNKNTFVTEVN